MKNCILSILCLLSYKALCQEISVEHDKFPGVKTVIVRSGRSGYWGKYELDESGRAKTETRFKNKEHLATREYEFTRNGYLKASTTTFDINSPHTTHAIYDTYVFSPDSSKVLKTWCYTVTDTLYVVTYSQFEGNHPTHYRKVVPRRSEPWIEDINLVYTNDKLVKWESKDKADSVATRCEYSYNERGTVIIERRSMLPANRYSNLWIDGQGDFLQWEYEYDKAGRWIRKYQIYKGHRSLAETRKFIERKPEKL